MAQLLVYGAGEEVAVGVSLDRSPELFVALLAVLKAGAVYVPLDPRDPRERLERIVEDAGIDLIVSRRALAGKLPATAHVVHIDALEAPSSPGVPVPRPGTRPDALACVIYTSGSTGRPKGVAIEQRQLLNRLRWMWHTYPFSDGEVACQKTGVAFVDSLWELLGPLLQGVPTVIVSEESARDPDSLVEVLGRQRVTRILLVPSLLRSLLERHGDLERRLPDLTLWLGSGEELPAALAKQFEDQLPHAVLCNVYGASEAWDATCYDPRDGGARDGRVPIGRPIANMRAYVLDALLEPVPPGIPGELHVGGAGVARGYVRNAALTAATFVPDPFSPEPGARLYRTGDLTRYREDGSIEFLGRVDHQVKLRGLRVELGEIEGALEQHPTVRRAVVQLWDDVGDEPRLVAYVVPEPEDGSADDRHALAWRRFLRRTLPDYMLPAAFVTLSALPLTATGKLDRRALPPPDGAISLLARSYVAPRTSLEADLAAIWSELLGVDRVGIYDSFFDLGGHSLLGIRVLSRVQESFHVAISARVIFETPTVAGLAARIASAQARGDADETTPIIPLSREEHTAIVVLDAGPGSELAFADDRQP
jgi:amino acid adenylation domain-containing protein